MIGDRYTLDREIGRGGMGSVWLGRDEVLGRAVALKRVGEAPGGAHPDLMRAEREARIAASLNHPNIVGVFDLVHDGDLRYLVMEYVEGVTLAELVRERGPLPQQQAARILAQVASALTAAHANQVVHRDVKPSNILVRDDGQVKLSDFGIARSEADASLTQTGLVTGSPAYLSPEVASGKLAGPSSDVWSLGATLFHALAGRPPYDVGDNVLGSLYQIVNEPPPRLEGAGRMEPVLVATMATDPAQRWSMEDVAGVLEQLSTADPTTGPVTAHMPTGETRQLRAVPAATEVLPTPALSPTPAPAPAAPRAPRSRRTLPLVVGGLVLALLGVIVALALTDDPQTTTGAPGEATSSAGAAVTPTPTDRPTSEPPTSDAAPTQSDLEAFVTSYLETASSDPAAGFAQLTPSFQAASNGLEGYESFWGEVVSTRLLDVSADPKALTVTYTYSYNLRGGGGTTEEVSLQLVRDGDRLLIDGEA